MLMGNSDLCGLGVRVFDAAAVDSEVANIKTEEDNM